MRALDRVRLSGASMIEVLLVVAILSILAVASVPMYVSSVRRAKTGEATAAMAAIHHEEFRVKTESGSYLAVDAGDVANEPSDKDPGMGLDFGSNAYFGSGCFSVKLDDTQGFIVECDGGASGNSAPRRAEVAGTVLNMRGTSRQTRVSYDGGSTWSPWQ